MQQRKSRRLVAKAEKQAETRQFDDEHALSSNGQLGTSCLLQSCSAEDVALLASQVWPQHSMQDPLKHLAAAPSMWPLGPLTHL